MKQDGTLDTADYERAAFSEYLRIMPRQAIADPEPERWQDGIHSRWVIPVVTIASAPASGKPNLAIVVVLGAVLAILGAVVVIIAGGMA